MENIIIDLANSRNAQKFSTENLIHIKEFRRVEEWIDQRLADIDNMKKTDCNTDRSEFIRLHETITVLGTRGSGKTSFLLSVLDKCRKKDIEVIRIFDPTLIEDKGHIFLTILSEINHHVIDALNKMQCSPEKADYFNKKKWDDLLKKMARGLPAMDIINRGYEDWCDPEYVMNTGLQNVYAARTLEDNFHELLKFGLTILGKKAFVIALDDIDVDFRKGWPVLETIRKYMTSPYVITLLSGDLRLFSKAIRKQQWKNFGKSLLKNEGDILGQTKKYNDIVTEMESQYILKVIQPRRRVYLNTLKEKIGEIGDSFDIQIKGDGNEKHDVKITDRYKEILNELGIKNLYQMETYRSFLLGLPLRSQIQFLSIFDNSDEKSVRKKQSEIAETFLSEMYEKGIDADVIQMDKQHLIAIILHLLIKEKVLNESYQLQPTSTDTNLNIALMVLNFITSQKIYESPYIIFDYFIRIGYVRNILSVIGYRSNDKNILSPSIEHLCEFVGIYRDMELRDLACLITAYLQAVRNSSRVGDSYYGIINIHGLAKTQKQANDKMPKRIDSVFKDVSKELRNIAFLPLSFSQNNRANKGQLTYSVFTLLAAIGNLIRKVEAGTWNGLSITAQLRSYPKPAFEGGISSVEIDEMDIEISDSENKKEDGSKNNVDTDFVTWVKQFGKKPIDKKTTGKKPTAKKEEYSLPLHVLGKISTRLFYGLSSIETTGMKSDTNLGDSMHIRIILLMNAVLIEEVKELYPDKIRILNINNPVTNHKLFVDNLKNIKKAVDVSKLKLTQWMCCCPLLLAFLNLKDDDKKLLTSLQEFTGEKNMQKEYSVYEKLCEVTIPNVQVEKSKSQDEIVKNIEILKKSGVSSDLFKYNPDCTYKERLKINSNIRAKVETYLSGVNVDSKWIKKMCDYIEKHPESKW